MFRNNSIKAKKGNRLKTLKKHWTKNNKDDFLPQLCVFKEKIHENIKKNLREKNESLES